MSLKMSRLQ